MPNEISPFLNKEITKEVTDLPQAYSPFLNIYFIWSISANIDVKIHFNFKDNCKQKNYFFNLTVVI